ncbi:MAG: S-layer homology domain-containing protein, partial [Thermodesulfobacteriota bacterium]|nr:S-layer homology domain-containing protein [Thermodesulfobacteriota bacterium]
MKMKNILRSLWPVLLLVLVLGLSGCAKKPRKASGIMDSPEHHFNVGLNFLDSEEPAKAEKEFDLALELDPKYSPALGGKGLTLALRGDYEGSSDFVKRAGRVSKAASSEEKIWTVVMEIRTYTALAKAEQLSPTKLVMEIRDPFSRGKIVDSKAPALYFYMGEAYLQALEFPRSEEMYKTVLELQNGFEEKAGKRWQLVQKVNRAAPGSIVGKRIALVDKITRADLAGLLVEELGVAKFYSRTEEIKESTFEPPKGTQMTADDLYTKKGVIDIAEHPLKADIEQVMQFGVKGLQAYPDHTFRPQEPMTKAETAMIFEDVIIRATGKEETATQFIGQKSHIKDVRGDHPAFNAVMLCTTRGLMDTDIRTGLFKPLDPVSGVDALLSIKALKNDLSLF